MIGGGMADRSHFDDFKNWSRRLHDWLEVGRRGTFCDKTPPKYVVLDQVVLAKIRLQNCVFYCREYEFDVLRICRKIIHQITLHATSFKCKTDFGIIISLPIVLHRTS